jgi:hypothetical protein
MKHLRLRLSSLLSCLPVLATLVCGSPALHAQDSESFDLAKIRTGASVVYVSSGPKGAAFQAIDDDRRTTFRFSNSDLHPTLVVEFSESQPIHRVSIVPGSQGGTIDIYLLSELPRDPKNMGNAKPVASIVDLAVGREAAVEFEPRKVRYVVLQWTPNTTRSDAFVVAEVSAFSTSDSAQTAALLAAADPPPADPIVGPPVIISVSP